MSTWKLHSKEKPQTTKSGWNPTYSQKDAKFASYRYMNILTALYETGGNCYYEKWPPMGVGGGRWGGGVLTLMTKLFDHVVVSLKHSEAEWYYETTSTASNGIFLS